MTAETEKVRGSKDRRIRHKLPGFGGTSDEREAQGGQRASSSGRSRRDRVAPEGSSPPRMLKKEKTTNNGSNGKRKSSKSRRKLRVNTNADEVEDNPSTPLTAGSTPSCSPSGKTDLRSTTDLRSPGQRMSPVNGKTRRLADEDAPIPDLITQTDRYGRATTPRNQKAIEHAQTSKTSGRKSKLRDDNGEREGNEEADVCTETFFDSIRLMCCCIMPEDSQSKSLKNQGTVESNDEEPTVEPERPKLLPKHHPDDHGKKCLVLDLDETLVHSSFRAVVGADFVIPVQIEDVVHFVYVMKRPGVDEFLIEMAKHYEIVVYTASLNKYADPLLDLLDPERTIRSRLFRESCVYYEGNYVKDLSLLDRDLSQTIIVDNSPSSYSFHTKNAIDCSSFIDDPNDRELDQIAAFLTGIQKVRDVRDHCHKWRNWPKGQIAEDQ